MPGFGNVAETGNAFLRQALSVPWLARPIGLGKIRGTVSCGGVPVINGDYVMADCDGIIVASAAELEKLLPIAEAAHQADAGVFERMSAGESLFDLLNVVEHAEALQRGETSSKLKFATE